MNEQSFSLQPFGLNPLPDLKINGSIARNANRLTVRYALLGDLAKIIIPAIADLPARKHELWQETCFEFFLGIENSTRYWEFNLSPAGHWNVYCFDDYRQGMQEELAIASLPFSVQRQASALLLTLELDLNECILADRTLDVAVTAVVKSKDEDVTYWALSHRGSQADFHRRDSFIIKL
ncbi:MAG: DOMON-like domain-containing protein [Hydrococcus sp. C42_A2020_068]|uniref:DOMON-like domain-containing protein n=1 Tax=Pleurocapsa sp. PCC 7327 TaxID=118163 RepID=UPI00029FDD55|nr:DOMON-like domain-containing protein [Pleurocapsa sp. PCC 7327]AFY79138.1 hypothetical protein Ple7327_3995 [Pleurocapsa sp. PCC 7327]MBF2020749.1 DOMON-like domain-containing protein [Hydrococcus sp. C42_A2020_068]